MIAFITRLFAPGEPHLSEAVLSDARDLAELHAACFRRGWSDEEFARLLEATVVTHRAIIAKSIAGFILSRRASDEAEILSIAVTASRRDAGLPAAFSICICGAWLASGTRRPPRGR